MGDDTLALIPPLIHAFHAGVVEPGAIGAGIHRHHLHAIRLEFVMHRRTDAFHGMFRRGIGAVECYLDQPRNRRCPHDPAGFALHHLPRKPLCQREGSEHIGFKDGAEHLHRYFRHRPRFHDARVVEQHVDVARQYLTAVYLIKDIELDHFDRQPLRVRSMAHFPYLRPDLASRDHLVTLGSQAESNAAPEPRCRAGDQNRLDHSSSSLVRPASPEPPSFRCPVPPPLPTPGSPAPCSSRRAAGGYGADGFRWSAPTARAAERYPIAYGPMRPNAEFHARAG